MKVETSKPSGKIAGAEEHKDDAFHIESLKKMTPQRAGSEKKDFVMSWLIYLKTIYMCNTYCVKIWFLWHRNVNIKTITNM